MATIDYESYRLIRRLYAVERLSQRQIAKQLNVSRHTVSRYCDGKVTPDTKYKFQMIKSDTRITIEKEIVRILEQNKTAPSKQKLNAKVIWQMLNKTGYDIGESTIRKYIQEMRIDEPDIFIPLEFEPGEAMEFDWGDAYAYINGVKTRISLFCSVLPYSYGIFAAVFPDKTNASFFTGHVMAFSHFNGVPLRCIYDNNKSVVLEGSGRNAIKQEKYKKFEAHYAFEGILCNAASGWEKGAVENLVSIVRKIAFTPMPHFDNFTAMQEHVSQRCLEYCMNHKIKGHKSSIWEMLAEEKQHLLPLPAHHMDPAEEIKALVHSDLTVRLNGVRYSVPANLVGLSVTLKISPFHVDIYHDGESIFRHRKALNQSDNQYVLEHYLDILLEKRRAIKNAAPIKSGVMPVELSQFQKLCTHRDKNCQLVNIMLLGRKLSSETLLWAVRQANSTGSPSYDLVCFYLDILNTKNTDAINIDDAVKVEKVDFNQYDDLI